MANINTSSFSQVSLIESNVSNQNNSVGSRSVLHGLYDDITISYGPSFNGKIGPPNNSVINCILNDQSRSFTHKQHKHFHRKLNKKSKDPRKEKSAKKSEKRDKIGFNSLKAERGGLNRPNQCYNRQTNLYNKIFPHYSVSKDLRIPKIFDEKSTSDHKSPTMNSDPEPSTSSQETNPIDSTPENSTPEMKQPDPDFVKPQRREYRKKGHKKDSSDKDNISMLAKCVKIFKDEKLEIEKAKSQGESYVVPVVKKCKISVKSKRKHPEGEMKWFMDLSHESKQDFLYNHYKLFDWIVFRNKQGESKLVDCPRFLHFDEYSTFTQEDLDEMAAHPELAKYVPKVIERQEEKNQMNPNLNSSETLEEILVSIDQYNLLTSQKCDIEKMISLNNSKEPEAQVDPTTNCRILKKNVKSFKQTESQLVAKLTNRAENMQLQAVCKTRRKQELTQITREEPEFESSPKQDTFDGRSSQNQSTEQKQLESIQDFVVNFNPEKDLNEMNKSFRNTLNDLVPSTDITSVKIKEINEGVEINYEVETMLKNIQEDKSENNTIENLFKLPIEEPVTGWEFSSNQNQPENMNYKTLDELQKNEILNKSFNNDLESSPSRDILMINDDMILEDLEDYPFLNSVKDVFPGVDTTSNVKSTNENNNAMIDEKRTECYNSDQNTRNECDDKEDALEQNTSPKTDNLDAYTDKIKEEEVDEENSTSSDSESDSESSTNSDSDSESASDNDLGETQKSQIYNLDSVQSSNWETPLAEIKLSNSPNENYLIVEEKTECNDSDQNIKNECDDQEDLLENNKSLRNENLDASTDKTKVEEILDENLTSFNIKSDSESSTNSDPDTESDCDNDLGETQKSEMSSQICNPDPVQSSNWETPLAEIKLSNSPNENYLLVEEKTECHDLDQNIKNECDDQEDLLEKNKSLRNENLDASTDKTKVEEILDENLTSFNIKSDSESSTNSDPDTESDCDNDLGETQKSEMSSQICNPDPVQSSNWETPLAEIKLSNSPNENYLLVEEKTECHDLDQNIKNECDDQEDLLEKNKSLRNENLDASTDKTKVEEILDENLTSFNIKSDSESSTNSDPDTESDYDNDLEETQKSEMSSQICNPDPVQSSNWETPLAEIKLSNSPNEKYLIVEEKTECNDSDQNIKNECDDQEDLLEKNKSPKNENLDASTAKTKDFLDENPTSVNIKTDSESSTNSDPDTESDSDNDLGMFSQICNPVQSSNWETSSAEMKLSNSPNENDLIVEEKTECNDPDQNIKNECDKEDLLENLDASTDKTKVEEILDENLTSFNIKSDSESSANSNPGTESDSDNDLEETQKSKISSQVCSLDSFQSNNSENPSTTRLPEINFSNFNKPTLFKDTSYSNYEDSNEKYFKPSQFDVENSKVESVRDFVNPSNEDIEGNDEAASSSSEKSKLFIDIYSPLSLSPFGEKKDDSDEENPSSPKEPITKEENSNSSSSESSSEATQSGEEETNSVKSSSCDNKVNIKDEPCDEPKEASNESFKSNFQESNFEKLPNVSSVSSEHLSPISKKIIDLSERDDISSIFNEDIKEKLVVPKIENIEIKKEEIITYTDRLTEENEASESRIQYESIQIDPFNESETKLAVLKITESTDPDQNQTEEINHEENVFDIMGANKSINPLRSEEKIDLTELIDNESEAKENISPTCSNNSRQSIEAQPEHFSDSNFLEKLLNKQMQNNPSIELQQVVGLLQKSGIFKPAPKINNFNYSYVDPIDIICLSSDDEEQAEIKSEVTTPQKDEMIVHDVDALESKVWIERDVKEILIDVPDPLIKSIDDEDTKNFVINNVGQLIRNKYFEDKIDKEIEENLEKRNEKLMACINLELKEEDTIKNIKKWSRTDSGIASQETFSSQNSQPIDPENYQPPTELPVLDLSPMAEIKIEPVVKQKTPIRKRLSRLDVLLMEQANFFNQPINANKSIIQKYENLDELPRCYNLRSSTRLRTRAMSLPLPKPRAPRKPKKLNVTIDHIPTHKKRQIKSPKQPQPKKPRVSSPRKSKNILANPFYEYIPEILESELPKRMTRSSLRELRETPTKMSESNQSLNIFYFNDGQQSTPLVKGDFEMTNLSFREQSERIYNKLFDREDDLSLIDDKNKIKADNLVYDNKMANFETETNDVGIVKNGDMSNNVESTNFSIKQEDINMKASGSKSSNLQEDSIMGSGRKRRKRAPFRHYVRRKKSRKELDCIKPSVNEGGYDRKNDANDIINQNPTQIEVNDQKLDQTNQTNDLMNYLTSPEVGSMQTFPSRNYTVYTVLLSNTCEATSSQLKRKNGANVDTKRPDLIRSDTRHHTTRSDRQYTCESQKVMEEIPSRPKRNRGEAVPTSAMFLYPCPIQLEKTLNGKGCKNIKVRTWRQAMLDLKIIENETPFVFEETPPSKPTKPSDSDSEENEEYEEVISRQLIQRLAENNKAIQNLPPVFIYAFNNISQVKPKKNIDTQNLYSIVIKSNFLQVIDMNCVISTFKNLIKLLGFAKMFNETGTSLVTGRKCVDCETKDKYFYEYKKQLSSLINQIINTVRIVGNYKVLINENEDSVGYLNLEINPWIGNSEANSTLFECDYVTGISNLNGSAMDPYQLPADFCDDIPAKETRKEKQLFLLARNPDGNFIGIKVGAESGSETPSTSEMARLRHLSNSISNALQYKSDVERGEVAPDPARVVTNLQLSVEERILAIEASVVERKQQRLKWLQIESKLVEHDSEIKSYLGLEKADTEKALECLNQILNLNVEQLMLTKHPHVIDMVKRLRRYIGNIKSWNLSREQIDGFAKGAELIRKKADEVYQKFKALYQMEPEKTFSDIYNEHVADFKEQTKHMTEPQRFAVCAKPGTKLFESDEVDDKLEVEAIKLKNEIDKKKTPKGSTMNFDA